MQTSPVQWVLKESYTFYYRTRIICKYVPTLLYPILFLHVLTLLSLGV